MRPLLTIVVFAAIFWVFWITWVWVRTYFKTHDFSKGSFKNYKFKKK